jgi:hypothetical protein
MYWRAYRRRLYLAVDAALLDCLSEPVAPPQERDDLLHDLRQMIERLPPRCRSLLALRFQLGYEPAEVARRLGYRGSSIGQVTHRCLAALSREMLAGASSRVAFAVPVEALAVAPARAIRAAAPKRPAAAAVSPAPAGAADAALAPASPASSLPPLAPFSSVPRIPPNSPVSRLSPPLEVRLRRR